VLQRLEQKKILLRAFLNGLYAGFLLEGRLLCAMAPSCPGAKKEKKP
jgi:hypothetical protein